MDRLKEFLRRKGFYIALGTGVLAVVALMVVYNYNYYKGEIGGVSVDLNTPEQTQDDDNSGEEVTKTNSDDAVAGNTDAGNTETTEESQDNQTAEAETMEDSQDSQTAEAKTTEGSQNSQTAEAETTEGSQDSQTAKLQTTEATDMATNESTTSEEIASAESDGVIVNEQGEIVANSYTEGSVLVWPVEGAVILPYSMDTTVYFKTLKSYRCNPGMLIGAKEGSDVLAAYEGVVESVDEDKEHGTVVTIIMGNGYKAKYGQLMNVTVAKGDAVNTAQNIGEVAPVTSYYAEEGAHVYFELQKDEKPVNPILYMQ